MNEEIGEDIKSIRELIDKLVEEDNSLNREQYLLLLIKLGHIKNGIYNVIEIAYILRVSRQVIYVVLNRVESILKKDKEFKDLINEY